MLVELADVGRPDGCSGVIAKASFIWDVRPLSGHTAVSQQLHIDFEVLFVVFHVPRAPCPLKYLFCAQLTGRQNDKRLAAISPLISDLLLLVVPGSHRELKDLARLHGWSDEAQCYINSTKGRVESMLLFRV